MTSLKAGLVAALAAALPLIAAPAQAETVVKISDLDVSTAAGKAEFAQRVDRAAREFCKRDVRSAKIIQTRACIAAVQVEMDEKLAAVQGAESRAFAQR